MMDIPFVSFSLQHFITLAVFVLFTVVLILIGLRASTEMKGWIGYSVASMAFAVMVFDLLMRIVTHTFDKLNDLPLFLCDLVALFLPIVILKRNRKWLGIFYFWSLAGTIQALITPELKSGFPSFEFFRYFIMHGGVVASVLYCVIVFKLRMTWRDLWNAVIYIQFYLIAIHVVNMILRSNYSYTMAKPASSTILDFMGSWPWYILSGEVLMFILFMVLLVPFLFYRGGEKPEFAGIEG